jgi:hypothetical protein
MLRVPLGADDSFLLLAPAWSGWTPAGQIAALAIALVVPLALVLWLYRWELRLVSRRAAACLLGFRLIAVALVWVLAALQPTIVHIRSDETPSRVLVAVDLSGSMEIADPQRPWPEKLQLARALNLPEGIASAQLDAWSAAAERGMLSRDPALDALGAAIDALSRKEIARRLLLAPDLALLARLGAAHHVDVAGFEQALLDGSAPNAAALLGKTLPASALTDLGPPLQRALEPGGTGKLLGVILLTDGQHNRGSPPLALAGELGERGVPIYAVALGSKQPPVDVAVVEVQAPAQVFKDAEATVAARVRVQGLPAQQLAVELHGLPGEVKQEKKIQHDGSNRVYLVEFAVKLEQIGTQRLDIHAQPTLKSVEETTTENNRLATVVRVAAEKSRILIVEDEPRWEYYYLETALVRDPDLHVERVLLSPPRLGTAPDDKLEKLGHAKRRLPDLVQGKEDPLWQYDGIVLGDVPPERLPLAERQRLERYVADRGGTLMLVAGKRHLPLGYLPFTADDPLGKLLPIENPQPRTSKQGFAPVLTEAGEKTPFFQIEASAEASRQRWAELPKHFWGVIGNAKPGGTVLARAVDPGAGLPLTPGPSPQEGERGESQAHGLIVQQHYGFGKVLFIGLDSTWRWRYRVGDRYHHRFWGQLMRWAVSDPFLPEGNRFIRFGAKAPVYRHDQEIELLARFGEEVALPTSVKMKILRQRDGQPAETAAEVTLVPQEKRPRQWEAKIKQLPPGTYRLEVDIPELRDKLADSEAGKPHGFTVTPPESAEHADLATNWELLQTLAAASGGRVFSAAEADELPGLLARQVQRREIRTEERPWQDLPLAGWVLGTLIGLLTIEWSLRKLAGLP